MIYSLHPSEKMKNQVTLGANMKYVLIKLCEEVANEASPSCASHAPINYTTKSSTDSRLADSFLSVSREILERMGPFSSRRRE